MNHKKCSLFRLRRRSLLERGIPSKNRSVEPRTILNQELFTIRGFPLCVYTHNQYQKGNCRFIKICTVERIRQLFPLLLSIFLKSTYVSQLYEDVYTSISLSNEEKLLSSFWFFSFLFIQDVFIISSFSFLSVSFPKQCVHVNGTFFRSVTFISSS